MRNHQLPKFVTLVLLLGSVAVQGGCGQQGTPTYPVTGAVLLDGKPVPEGDIAFFNLSPSLGPNAGKIEGGRFAFRAYAGTARVEIEARRLLPGVPPGPMGIPATERYIPDQYNRKSTLQVEILPEANEFNFDLKSK